MTVDWVPGLERIDLPFSGGAYTVPVERAIWHTSEGDSIEGAISTLRSKRVAYHILWQPRTGRIVQALPLNVAASAVSHTVPSVQTNRLGAIQVCIIGFAHDPFTQRPHWGLERVLGILRDAGVRDGWPMGQPLPYPQSYGLGNGQRNTVVWLARPGHYAHSQVPQNEHGDPGAVDIKQLTTATQPTPTPSHHQELDMPFMCRVKGQTAVWVITGSTMHGPISQKQVDTFAFLGIANGRHADGTVGELDADIFADLKVI